MPQVTGNMNPRTPNLTRKVMTKMLFTVKLSPGKIKQESSNTYC